MAWDDDDRNEEYFNCPVEGCGEALLLTELESHIEMHEEEPALTRAGQGWQYTGVR